MARIQSQSGTGCRFPLHSNVPSPRGTAIYPPCWATRQIVVGGNPSPSHDRRRVWNPIRKRMIPTRYRAFEEQIRERYEGQD